MNRSTTLGTSVLGIACLAACGGASPSPEPLPPPPEFRKTIAQPAPTENAVSPGDQQIPPDEVVYFAFASARLTPEAKRDLIAVAQWLDAHPEQRLVIAGHTDRIGDSEYNLALSARRALAVEQFLRSVAADTDRIDIYAYGELDAAGRPHAVNRRVIVYATDRDHAMELAQALAVRHTMRDLEREER